MTSLSKEDYQRLLEEFYDEQYGRDESSEEDYVPEESWIPAEPVAKELMRLNLNNGTINITNFKKDKIQEALYKCKNIVVGNFSILIEAYHGYPDPKKQSS